MNNIKTEDWTMLCICDYAGQVRGKAVPLYESEKRYQHGMGIAPTSLMITAFGAISNSPWGARGEVLMIPDSSTEVYLPAFQSGEFDEKFVLCDLVELNGEPWPCCPRLWLTHGLQQLKDEFGFELRSAFEQEFYYSGAEGRLGDSYLLDAMRLQGSFASTLMGQMRANGIEPEAFMPEYGAAQFEITVKPTIGTCTADTAVATREIARSVARKLGHRVSFSPVMEPNVVGNGTHIHFSLEEKNGNPISYDPDQPNNISTPAGSFVAGILAHMREILALTAPSKVSYERLQPNRWSSTWNNLGILDREAGVRLCPISSRSGSDPSSSMNFEYRASDGAASPYMVLGALVYAGLDGLRKQMKLPEPTTVDPTEISEEDQKRHQLERLPQSLEEALDIMEKSQFIQDAMGTEFQDAYLIHKRSELSQLAELSEDEVFEKYANAY